MRWPPYFFVFLVREWRYRHVGQAGDHSLRHASFRFASRNVRLAVNGRKKGASAAANMGTSLWAGDAGAAGKLWQASTRY